MALRISFHPLISGESNRGRGDPHARSLLHRLSRGAFRPPAPRGRKSCALRAGPTIRSAVRARSRSPGSSPGKSAAGLAVTALLATSSARAQAPEALEVTVRGASAGNLRRRPEQSLRAGHVEKRLVDPKPFNEGGYVIEDLHDLFREISILLEMRLEHDRLRAESEGLRKRDGRAHTVLASRIVCRRHHRSQRLAGNDNGKVGEFRPIEKLDGREKRVKVHMQNRGGAAINRICTDLAVAPVLPAHRVFLISRKNLPVAGDTNDRQCRPRRARRLRAASSLVELRPSSLPTSTRMRRVAVIAGHHARRSPSILRYSTGMDATAPAKRIL